MISGSVREDGDAVVSIRVIGFNSPQIEVDCIIDTGFNEALTLSSDLIGVLGLPSLGRATFTLADGSRGTANIFDAKVEWLDELRRVVILEMDGTPLIGMALLHGSRLTIDVAPNGRVLIEPLLSSP